jgi:hypothetical protein
VPFTTFLYVCVTGWRLFSRIEKEAVDTLKKREQVKTLLFIIMLATTLILIILHHQTVYFSSGIMIGQLPYQLYVPALSDTDTPISFNYLNSCNECLCYAISSTTTSYVAVNCLTDSHICYFYTSYDSNYSFQWNATSYLYFFQIPPPMTTAMSSQMTTYTMTTTTFTCKFRICHYFLSDR